MNSNRKPRILVVDDVPGNLKVLRSILIDKYDLTLTTTGEGALELIKDTTVDLVLLDVMMPVMDGFTLCKKLKVLENTTDVPIIFITGKNDDMDIEQGLAIGGVDYITKPICSSLLIARVETHLELSRLKKLV